MFKIFLFILALILSGTATFLTASGMALLFSGLWFLFITIDIGRFFVTDYLIKGWKKISGIKWFTTCILSLLLILSSVGVYNALDQRIPKDMHNAIVEAASYNKATLNNERTQDINKTGYEIALTEYNNQVSAYDIQKNACLNKEGADQEKCIRTYNANLSSAKKRLDSAKKEYTASINDSSKSTTEEYKNKTEIAGILTTICQFTGGNCDTTNGLTRALRIIILLIILGLEIFAINILFIIHSKEDKPEEKKEIKLPKITLPKIKLPKIKKKSVGDQSEPKIYTNKKVEKVEKPIIEEKVVEEKVNVESKSEPKIHTNSEMKEPEIVEQISNFINSKLINGKTESNDKVLSFDEVIKILEKNPSLMENSKIKKILSANPSLKKDIEKKVKD